MNCSDVRSLLDEFIDNDLDPGRAVEVEDHIARCASCAEEARVVRNLRQSAQQLPRSIDPRRDLWPGIEDAIFREDMRRWRYGRRMLAAAAAAIVVGGSIVVAYLVGLRHGGPQSADEGSLRRVITSSVVRASAGGLERGTVRTRNELIAALEARRDELSPETVEVVTQNLMIIDEAIARIESALAEHPDDAQLLHCLAEAKRQEISLLERAARLPAET